MKVLFMSAVVLFCIGVTTGCMSPPLVSESEYARDVALLEGALLAECKKADSIEEISSVYYRSYPFPGVQSLARKKWDEMAGPLAEGAKSHVDCLYVIGLCRRTSVPYMTVRTKLDIIYQGHFGLPSAEVKGEK
jgi:hypothetical protein